MPNFAQLKMQTLALVALALGCWIADPYFVLGEGTYTETGSCGIDPSLSGVAGLAVPVIDVGPIMEPNSHTAKEVEQAVHEVYTACQEWGFFQRTATNARGWYDDELTKQTLDWKQGFDLGHVPHPSLPPDDPANVVAEGYNQWPKGIPGFKDTMDAFYSEAARVSSRLMWGISHSLGLHGGVVGAGAGMEMGGDILAEAFEGHTSYLRLNYYPPCPEPCDYLSVNRHTDAGALTVLLQEAGVTALQVNFNGTGQWVSIPPVEGAVTINVGDMLQVWTNDLFRAPEHRVRALTERDRFSAPFFYNPGYATDVAPLPQTLLAHTITTSSSSSSSPSCISTPADDGGGAGKVGDPNNSVGGGTIVRGEGSAGGGRNHCREDGNPGEERGKAAGFGATTGESSAGGGGSVAAGAAGARYRSLNWGEYRLKRFQGDFADHGTEVQIENFRLG